MATDSPGTPVATDDYDYRSDTVMAQVGTANEFAPSVTSTQYPQSCATPNFNETIPPHLLLPNKQPYPLFGYYEDISDDDQVGFNKSGTIAPPGIQNIHNNSEFPSLGSGKAINKSQKQQKKSNAS